MRRFFRPIASPVLTADSATGFGGQAVLLLVALGATATPVVPDAAGAASGAFHFEKPRFAFFNVPTVLPALCISFHALYMSAPFETMR